MCTGAAGLISRPGCSETVRSVPNSALNSSVRMLLEAVLPTDMNPQRIDGGTMISRK